MLLRQHVESQFVFLQLITFQWLKRMGFPRTFFSYTITSYMKIRAYPQLMNSTPAQKEWWSAFSIRYSSYPSFVLPLQQTRIHKQEYISASKWSPTTPLGVEFRVESTDVLLGLVANFCIRVPCSSFLQQYCGYSRICRLRQSKSNIFFWKRYARDWSHTGQERFPIGLKLLYVFRDVQHWENQREWDAYAENSHPIGRDRKEAETADTSLSKPPWKEGNREASEKA